MPLDNVLSLAFVGLLTCAGFAVAVALRSAWFRWVK